MEEINAEANKSKSALYKIKAYPTFKLETTQKVFEMKGPITPSTLNTFLETALGKKVQKSSSSN